MRSPRLLRLLPLPVLLTFAPAAAQQIDYDALQQTIGEPVTTSVTGKPQRQSETSASTTIITREEIVRSPARDVPGLLKTYAGIDVNRWTAGQNDVAVRGGVQTFNARLLVLVDGRQVYLDHYGFTDWNLIGVQLDDIQQIELVRGPASALFGFNAASGVINIITRKPNEAALRATASAGNHGFGQLSATASVPLSPVIAAKITAGRLREDERAIPSELVRPLTVRSVAADQVMGQLAGSFGQTGVTLGGGYATNRQLEALPSQLLSYDRYRSGNLNAGLTQDTDWGGFSANGYVNWLNASYAVEDAGSASSAANIRNRIAVLRGSALYRLGDEAVARLGVEYRNNRMRGNAQFAESISYDVLAGEAMLDVHANDRITLTGAARLDRLWLRPGGAVAQPQFDDADDFHRSFTRLSLNAAVLVRTGEHGLLRINGGRGYQLPSLINLGLRLPTAAPAQLPIFVAGSPTITPVRIWSAEAAYSQDLGLAQVEATAFYNHTTGVIASPGDNIQNIELVFLPGPTLVTRFGNAGNYSAYGTELSVRGRLASLSWRANYTWTHIEEDLTGTTAPYDFAVAPRAATPKHKANLVLGWESGPWQLSGVARYTSATRQFAFTSPQTLDLLRVDAAVALDARVAYRLTPAMEVFAAGENLGLAKGAAGSLVPSDRRLRGGVRLTL